MSPIDVIAWNLMNIYNDDSHANFTRQQKSYEKKKQKQKREKKERKN